MRYTSTRGRHINVSFEEAISSGYAPDGGLFVPVDAFNNQKKLIDHQVLEKWRSLKYLDLAYEVIRNFIDVEEICDDDLRRICALSFEEFDCEEIVPVIPLNNNFFVSELFHGPTFCFKDLGMKALVNFLAYFSEKKRKKSVLVVSTTGDTGPAALHAVCSLPKQQQEFVKILVHYPSGQISSFQRKQLTTVQAANAKVVAFEGGGDDMDLPIKNMIIAQDIDPDVQLCGINSYNIGRPLMQMLHYIWTYLRVTDMDRFNMNEKLDIVLPTGAMGNIVGGYMAKKMGLPIGMLCAGVNINDITYRTFVDGNFHRSDRMEKTLSDAINIQVPYNFERLLFYLTNEDHTLVNEWMTVMDNTQKLTLDRSWLAKLQNEFRSARIDDNEMCDTICRVKKDCDYLIDPHTAVAFAAASQLGFSYSTATKSNPVAVLATASPCKFEESVTAAIGEENWSAYVNNETEFPMKARLVLNRVEQSPIEYKYDSEYSLRENQRKWEHFASNIIKDMIV